jgi:hypothetical protein
MQQKITPKDQVATKEQICKTAVGQGVSKPIHQSTEVFMSLLSKDERKAETMETKGQPSWYRNRLQGTTVTALFCAIRAAVSSVGSFSDVIRSDNDRMQPWFMRTGVTTRLPSNLTWSHWIPILNYTSARIQKVRIIDDLAAKVDNFTSDRDEVADAAKLRKKIGEAPSFSLVSSEYHNFQKRLSGLLQDAAQNMERPLSQHIVVRVNDDLVGGLGRYFTFLQAMELYQPAVNAATLTAVAESLSDAAKSQILYLSVVKFVCDKSSALYTAIGCGLSLKELWGVTARTLTRASGMKKWLS